MPDWGVLFLPRNKCSVVRLMAILSLQPTTCCCSFVHAAPHRFYPEGSNHVPSGDLDIKVSGERASDCLVLQWRRRRRRRRYLQLVGRLLCYQQPADYYITASDKAHRRRRGMYLRLPPDKSKCLRIVEDRNSSLVPIPHLLMKVRLCGICLITAQNKIQYYKAHCNQTEWEVFNQ